MSEIGERLASIETKVDLLLERSTEDRTDFRSRLSKVEAWRYGTGAAVLGSIIAVVTSSTAQ